MRIDKLTTKFQEALGEAQSAALAQDHAYIEPAHVLGAMLRQDDGPKALLQTPVLLVSSLALILLLASYRAFARFLAFRA